MNGKKMTATLSLLLACVSFCACGGGGTSAGGGNSSSAKGTKIVIYAGGSSEYAWVKGSEEEDVIDYIEDKYYEDTGVKLDFEVSYLGQDMKTKLGNELGAGSQIDIAISHTGGGDGIDDYLLGGNMYYDLDDTLYRYGKNILAKTEGNALDRMTTVENKVVGIPSVIDPKKYGILVRKDWMEACGYTDDAEKAGTEFAGGQNYRLVDNLDTFEEMCLAMKEKYSLKHVITGAPWDLEKVLTVGAYSDAGYFTYGIRDEKVVPGYAMEEYGEVLQREYGWATKQLVAKSSSTIFVADGEKNFIAGSTGVFVLDPTVQHLIRVARSAKAVNPEAQFTVLGALAAHKGGTKKGFMRNSEATFAACVSSTSKNVKTILNFVNWMYGDASRYNLCRYGIEGTHWIDHGDGTYSYPEGKDGYLVSPPYSGILALVENQNVSNLTYRGYFAEELSWIAEAAREENYIDNDLVNYLWTVSAEIKKTYANAIAPIYNELAVPAWSGTSDPALKFDDLRHSYLTSLGKDYVDYITKDYRLMKEKRESK